MTPDIEDPMAWLAFATDGSESSAVYMTDGEAQAAADAWGWQVMPLYLAARLTDAEREAVAVAAVACASCHGFAGDPRIPAVYNGSEVAATLRGLLTRMSGGRDYPAPDNTATQDNSQFAKRESDSPQAIAECDATPPAHPTPAECSVPPEWTSKPYWVDPPAGHRYGFPRLYDPATDGDMTAWMIANGYPERLANQGLPCTFTAQTEDGGK
jgi:hypothetical protein